MTACYKADDYLYNVDEIMSNLSVEMNDSTLSANGVDSKVITFKFPYNADDQLTDLLVIASNGTFKESDNDSIKVNFTKLDATEKYKYSEVTFVSTASVSDCILRIEVLNHFMNDTIRFENARPVSIDVSSDIYFLKNDTISEMTLGTTVLSTNGVASSGQKIVLSVNENVGFFNTNLVTSGSSGGANFKYVFTDTSFVGPLTFTAKTTTVNNDTISGSKTINIID
ncbi:MAG: hypothetical protein ABJG68_09820 [Crocinitomicaceae bacterium]